MLSRPSEKSGGFFISVFSSRPGEKDKMQEKLKEDTP
jgi:hypothetical protein